MLRSDLGPHIAGAWWARGVGRRLEDRGDGPDGRVVFQPTPRLCTAGDYSQSLWPMDTDDTAASLASSPVPDEGTHE